MNLNIENQILELPRPDITSCKNMTDVWHASLVYAIVADKYHILKWRWFAEGDETVVGKAIFDTYVQRVKTFIEQNETIL